MGWICQEMPGTKHGREQGMMMWKHQESDAGTAADSASASSVAAKMLFYPCFWAVGSSSHRKQKALMPIGSNEAGKICTILSLLIVIRFFITQVVLRTRKLGSCILPAVLSHASCCRSVCSAVCSKAAKLKTKSRFQIKAAANHLFQEIAENVWSFFPLKKGVSFILKVFLLCCLWGFCYFWWKWCHLWSSFIENLMINSNTNSPLFLIFISTNLRNHKVWAWRDTALFPLAVNSAHFLFWKLPLHFPE